MESVIQKVPRDKVYIDYEEVPIQDQYAERKCTLIQYLIVIAALAPALWFYATQTLKVTHVALDPIPGETCTPLSRVSRTIFANWGTGVGGTAMTVTVDSLGLQDPSQCMSVIGDAMQSSAPVSTPNNLTAQLASMWPSSNYNNDLFRDKWTILLQYGVPNAPNDTIATQFPLGVGGYTEPYRVLINGRFNLPGKGLLNLDLTYQRLPSDDDFFDENSNTLPVTQEKLYALIWKQLQAFGWQSSRATTHPQSYTIIYLLGRTQFPNVYCMARNLNQVAELSTAAFALDDANGIMDPISSPTAWSKTDPRFSCPCSLHGLERAFMDITGESSWDRAITALHANVTTQACAKVEQLLGPWLCLTNQHPHWLTVISLTQAVIFGTLLGLLRIIFPCILKSKRCSRKAHRVTGKPEIVLVDAKQLR